MHGDEIFYVFGDPLRSANNSAVMYSDYERQLARMMMTHWANFAKTG